MTTLNLKRFWKTYCLWDDQGSDLSSPLVKKMWNVFVADNPTATEWIEAGPTIDTYEDLIEIAELQTR